MSFVPGFSIFLTRKMKHLGRSLDFTTQTLEILPERSVFGRFEEGELHFGVESPVQISSKCTVPSLAMILGALKAHESLVFETSNHIVWR